MNFHEKIANFSKSRNNSSSYLTRTFTQKNDFFMTNCNTQYILDYKKRDTKKFFTLNQNGENLLEPCDSNAKTYPILRVQSSKINNAMILNNAFKKEIPVRALRNNFSERALDQINSSNKFHTDLKMNTVLHTKFLEFNQICEEKRENTNIEGQLLIFRRFSLNLIELLAKQCDGGIINPNISSNRNLQDRGNHGNFNISLEEFEKFIEKNAKKMIEKHKKKEKFVIKKYKFIEANIAGFFDNVLHNIYKKICFISEKNEILNIGSVINLIHNEIIETTKDLIVKTPQKKEKFVLNRKKSIDVYLSADFINNIKVETKGTKKTIILLNKNPNRKLKTSLALTDMQNNKDHYKPIIDKQHDKNNFSEAIIFNENDKDNNTAILFNEQERNRNIIISKVITNPELKSQQKKKRAIIIKENNRKTTNFKENAVTNVNIFKQDKSNTKAKFCTRKAAPLSLKGNYSTTIKFNENTSNQHLIKIAIKSRRKPKKKRKKDGLSENESLIDDDKKKPLEKNSDIKVFIIPPNDRGNHDNLPSSNNKLSQYKIVENSKNLTLSVVHSNKIIRRSKSSLSSFSLECSNEKKLNSRGEEIIDQNVQTDLKVNVPKRVEVDLTTMPHFDITKLRGKAFRRYALTIEDENFTEREQLAYALEKKLEFESHKERDTNNDKECTHVKLQENATWKAQLFSRLSLMDDYKKAIDEDLERHKQDNKKVEKFNQMQERLNGFYESLNCLRSMTSEKRKIMDYKYKVKDSKSKCVLNNLLI